MFRLNQVYWLEYDDQIIDKSKLVEVFWNIFNMSWLDWLSYDRVGCKATFSTAGASSCIALGW
jgi:hypothetical protein